MTSDLACPFNIYGTESAFEMKMVLVCVLHNSVEL